MVRLIVIAILLFALIATGLYLFDALQAIGKWQAEAERLEIQAESDYYRGILSSCVGIGMAQGAPRQAVISRCAAYWRAAYEHDWFHELELDSWQWPPPMPESTGGTDA